MWVLYVKQILYVFQIIFRYTDMRARGVKGITVTAYPVKRAKRAE